MRLPVADGRDRCRPRSSERIDEPSGNAWGQQNGDYVVVLRQTAIDDGEEKEYLPAGDLVRAYETLVKEKELRAQFTELLRRYRERMPLRMEADLRDLFPVRA